MSNVLQIKKEILSVLLALLLAAAPSMTATSIKEHGAISGKVIDAGSREPLPHSNVFLANTTLGVVTDLLGNFAISAIPPGRYQLVANRVGYRPAIVDIQIGSGSRQEFTLQLLQKPIEAGEMQVVASVPKQWRAQLAHFKRAFLGQTSNARECVIENPEYLRFEIDSVTSELRAFSDAPLSILNQALGYRLYVVIDQFKWGEEIGYYAIFPRFELLTAKDEKEMLRWERNRRSTWLGSFRHFISALAQGQAELEGFQLSQKEPGQHRVSTGERIISTLIVENVENLGKKMHFGGYLEVNYRGGQTSSSIKMNQNFVMIEESGDIYPALSVVLYGTWAQQRIADTLPLDYHVSER